MGTKISVVVPTLINSAEQLEMTQSCINRAKARTSLPYELVIVETETDHLLEYADIYIHEKHRTNATKSINRGFRCCSGDYVVLLTNDVLVDDRWLECLVECFSKADCGASTLASTQFGHYKTPKIREGIWFSVAMVRREDAWFDENYVNSWDDSDLITRLYLRGEKMYRNHNCVVEHKVGNTQYAKPDHEENFNKNKIYYMEKYKDSHNERIYQIFTGGAVI